MTSVGQGGTWDGRKGRASIGAISLNPVPQATLWIMGLKLNPNEY